MAFVLYGVAGLVVVAGLIFAAFAPTEFMGAREAFYARLVLVAPAILVGLLIAAFGTLVQSVTRLERIARELLQRSRQVGLSEAPQAAHPLEPAFAEPGEPSIGVQQRPSAATIGLGTAAVAGGALAGAAILRAPSRAEPALAPVDLGPLDGPEPKAEPALTAQATPPEPDGWSEIETPAPALPQEPAAPEPPAEATTAAQWPDLQATRDDTPEAPDEDERSSQAARVAAALEAVLIADRAADEREHATPPVPAEDERLPDLPDLELSPAPSERRIEPLLRVEDLLDEPAPPEPAPAPVEPPAPAPEPVAVAEEPPPQPPPPAPAPPLRRWFENLQMNRAAQVKPAEPAPAPPPPVAPEPEAQPEPMSEPVAEAPQPPPPVPEPVPVPMPAPAPIAAPFVARVEEPAPEPEAEPETAAAAPEAEEPSGLPPEPEPMAEPPRPPTVAEILARGGEEPPAPAEPAPRIVREGQFAGRRYRMFENGSLEIDTDQSTIRFGSLDEFRAFVAAASKKQPEHAG